MLIVGENINTSRRRIAEAVEKQDAEFIIQIAKNQADQRHLEPSLPASLDIRSPDLQTFRRLRQ